MKKKYSFLNSDLSLFDAIKKLIAQNGAISIYEIKTNDTHTYIYFT